MSDLYHQGGWLAVVRPRRVGRAHQAQGRSQCMCPRMHAYIRVPEMSRRSRRMHCPRLSPAAVHVVPPWQCLSHASNATPTSVSCAYVSSTLCHSCNSMYSKVCQSMQRGACGTNTSGIR